MAARGSEAKEQVIKKIIECFGQEQTFIYDKKLYINTKENGERIQICLTLTCPKTLVGVDLAETTPKLDFSGGFDFEKMGAATAAPVEPAPVEITPEEKATVQDLMRRLGL